MPRPGNRNVSRCPSVSSIARVGDGLGKSNTLGRDIPATWVGSHEETGYMYSISSRSSSSGTSHVEIVGSMKIRRMSVSTRNPLVHWRSVVRIPLVSYSIGSPRSRCSQGLEFLPSGGTSLFRMPFGSPVRIIEGPRGRQAFLRVTSHQIRPASSSRKPRMPPPMPSSTPPMAPKMPPRDSGGPTATWGLSQLMS